MKILLIGTSSDIAQSLIKNNVEKYEFINISSSSSSFDILNEDTYPEINDNLDGFVYFPGTINLRPFSNLKLADFQNDYEINVLGLIKTLKYYNKLFNDKASIVFISSIAASVGMPFHSSISTSKSAIEGLCRSLAAEWSPSIRVNCVAPSLVKTKLSKRLLRTDSQAEQMKAKHPLNQFGEPRDISDAILFLLSKQSKWMTGQVLSVDGGLSKIKK